jgi:hypothetical protein
MPPRASEAGHPEVRFNEQAARHARLIGHDDAQIAELVELPHGLGCAGHEAEMLFQMGVAGVLDQHAVAIEEDGGNARIHGFRPYAAAPGRCNPSREVTEQDLALQQSIW